MQIIIYFRANNQIDIYLLQEDGPSKIFLEEKQFAPSKILRLGVTLGKIILFKDISKRLFLEQK